MSWQEGLHVGCETVLMSLQKFLALQNVSCEAHVKVAPCKNLRLNEDHEDRNGNNNITKYFVHSLVFYWPLKTENLNCSFFILCGSRIYPYLPQGFFISSLVPHYS